jgi:membrane-associated phospholipid phosphatase
LTWSAIALGYISYLGVVSFTRRAFARARPALVIAAVVAWGAYVPGGDAVLSPALSVIIPSLVLLAGYWLSGLLFVRPDVRLERWLHSVDHRALVGTGVLDAYRRAPRIVREFFELSYLLVYLAVPAGATMLAMSGRAGHVNRFWTVVLLAEFACYGMLPWLQTRPPRALESEDQLNAGDAGLRRLNLRIANRASIQVNTLPSGHAAGAFATAFAVMAITPAAGIAFLVLAVSISIATVLGRYHYAVDTVLGVAVAIAAWSVLSVMM